ncbi:MAG: T9SS type A sorting domain-containing protein, partial [Candidatus Cloacimonetes bacterium]|nr:T9SS type A sorting domain-containing protein [Candidatus Cloacimonadota bacterium]
PNDSVLFVEMTGSGTVWEGTFTPPGSGTYDVRISGSDSSGNTGVNFYQFEYIGVGVQDDELLSNKIMLSNYPNPFNPSTTISFNFSNDPGMHQGRQNEQIELSIYNLKGQKVKTFNVTLSGVEGSNGNEGFTPSPSTTLRMTQAGSKTYSIIWNGTDDNNKPVSSGIYFYKLESGDYQKIRKMILIK